VEFLAYTAIGLAMGLFGGLLGIGGSVVMIPALTFFFGEDQHLYQAAAMICNFFVAAVSLIAHRKAKAFLPDLLKFIIPAAIAGVIAGVALSNSPLFQGQNSYLLARIFGGFLVYVAVYNVWKFWAHPRTLENMPKRPKPLTNLLSALIGTLTGLSAGLLGIGAGTVATPLQQIKMKVPIRNAMSNSAITIVSIAWLGAIYKNATLNQHAVELAESFKIAAFIIPTAIIGSYIGSHLMHILPKNIVRAVFIVVCVLAAFKLLTVSPAA
jgi:hypothetical protein